jgi:hypothetical protein
MDVLFGFIALVLITQQDESLQLCEKNVYETYPVGPTDSKYLPLVDPRE